MDIINLVELLTNKGITVTQYMDKGKEFRRQWEQEFTTAVNRSVKRSIYFSDFLWHVFSYGKLPCLTNDEAKNSFEDEKKLDCYAFYQRSDVAYLLEYAEALRAEDFIEEQDIYLVDTSFIWTYVQTHESDCGPYFYKPILRR